MNRRDDRGTIPHLLSPDSKHRADSSADECYKMFRTLFKWLAELYLHRVQSRYGKRRIMVKIASGRMIQNRIPSVAKLRERIFRFDDFASFIAFRFEFAYWTGFPAKPHSRLTSENLGPNAPSGNLRDHFPRLTRSSDHFSQKPFSRENRSR